MITFLLTSLSGGLIGGSYVLLRTPRSGEENQIFVKEFIKSTRENIEDVSKEVSGLEQSLNNLNREIKNIQQSFIPDLFDITEDFKNNAAVSNRRIQDEMEEINLELEKLEDINK